MEFIHTKWFPLTGGFAVLALAILMGAAGWVVPRFSSCIAMFGVGFVLYGSAGVHGLPLLALNSPPQQRALAERILYTGRLAAHRYVLAVLVGAAFLAVNLITASELTVAIAMIGLVSAYGIVCLIDLFRAFREAGARTQLG